MIVIRIVLLFFYFLKEVVIANLQIAQLIFWNPKSIKPALIKVPLDVQTDRGIFLLSSMITLTPGTLSIEVTDDRKSLFVHVTHTDDPESVVQSIKAGFEKKLLEVGC